MYQIQIGGNIWSKGIMARKQKSKRKKRAERKAKIPFGDIRKPIPRPGTTMKSKKEYTRKRKHKSIWE
jgi:hypothetical protein